MALARLARRLGFAGVGHGRRRLRRLADTGSADPRPLRERTPARQGRVSSSASTPASRWSTRCGRARSRAWWSRTRSAWASSPSSRWSSISKNKPVEPKISTGEMLVTPENMNDPEIAKLIDPPQVENTSGASLSGAKSKKWRVIVIPKGTTHEFWKTLHAGTLKAADELGNVDVIWQGPQKEDDRVQQIQLVQNAIAAGVDGIVLAPLDARALVDPVEAAVAKGIPVVIFDSALESTKMVSYVATNNYNGGVLAGRRMGELLEGPGQGHPAALRGRLGKHRATRERLHRHARQGVSRDLAAFRHRIRGPDVRLGSAKSPEPGDAVPGPGRRDLLRERVEYVRNAAGP